MTSVVEGNVKFTICLTIMANDWSQGVEPGREMKHIDIVNTQYDRVNREKGSAAAQENKKQK